MLKEQHRKYNVDCNSTSKSCQKSLGVVFRVSPNELPFSSVTSWQAAYDFPPAGQSHLIKSEFYKAFGSGFDIPCIGSKRDPTEYARKKNPTLLRFPQRHSQYRSILCNAAGMIPSPKLALSANEVLEKSTLSAESRWSHLISWVRWRLARALAVLNMVSWDWRSPATNAPWQITDVLAII